MAFVKSGILAILSTLACLVPSAEAFAQSPPVRDATTSRDEVSPSDFSARGQAGGFYDPAQAGGILIGATALYRLGPVAVGGQFEGGGALFDYGFMGVGALGGVSLRPSTKLRVELLGTYGHHSYSGVGRGFMSDDPGVSGDSAYVGARAGASVIVGEKATHLEVGMYGGYDDDLSRDVKTSRYTSTGWFGDSSEQESEHTVGTKKYSLVVAVGMTHDVW